MAVDGTYAGHIVISDEIKAGAREAIHDLRSLGVRRTVMLTGDRTAVAEEVAHSLGVDAVRAELLPAEKVEAVETLLKEPGRRGRLLFVGDGINDAPVLSRADIGVAMGRLRSDAAIEEKLALAIRIARRTRRIVMENIVFALAVKALVLLLGALGTANMWWAVFADVGVCVIAVLNAMRMLRQREA